MGSVLDNLTVYVNSYGRSGRLITHAGVPTEVLRHSNFKTCIEESEAPSYMANDLVRHVLIVPDGSGLSKSRQIGLDKCRTKYAIFMDDDLKFYYRKKGELYLTGMTSSKFVRMLEDIVSELSRYAHVGVSGREGNNRVATDKVECSRMMRVLAYDVRRVRSLKCKFDRVWFKQDFDMTLQLLRRGAANCVLYKYAQNQSGGSNSAGGCHDQRTPTRMREAARRLKDLHPEFVEVVQKETKTSWGGGVRTDVKVSWKKAYKSASKL